MEWTREARLKLAREVRRISLEIQEEELARNLGKPSSFPETVENTIKRIMSRLEPLGFERAKGWFQMDGNLYRDSPTHLWFETAQARVVMISKKDAEKVLVLGFP